MLKSLFSKWIGISFFILSGCGSKGPDKPRDPTPRSGTTLAVKSGPSDSGAVLSSDGSKLVFVSTRDSGNAKIFKFEAAIGSGSSGKAKALFTNGVVSGDVRLQETRAWLSPDGATVLFTVESLQAPSAVSLYMADFASGTIQTNPVATTNGSIGFVVFSTDSKFFAYTVTLDTASTINVVETSKPQNQKALSLSGFQSAFFLKGSTYSLVCSSTVSTVVDAAPLFESVTFADANFNFSNPVAWGQSPDLGLFLNEPSFYSVGNSRVFYVQNGTKAQVIANGNAPALKANSVPTNYFELQNSSIASSDMTGSGWQSESWKLWGADVFSLSLSQADNVGVYLSSERHSCKGAPSESFPVGGRTLAFASFPSGGTATYTWFLPVQNLSSKVWSLANDPCSIPANSRADTGGILEASINAGALAKTYRVVYATGIDQQSQVFLIDLVGGVQTVLALP